MKERVPDSTGLPLRAMVMVLLFLGVIFLLLGWQALGTSGSSDDDSASPVPSSTATTSATSTSNKPAAAQADVQVYNISSKEGVAARTRDQLTSAGFKVTKVDNMAVPDVSSTTVYYTDADDERATADAVGKNLGAPVEPRIPALSSEPPGVIVLVAG
ncbi:LytR C-terminal domain-containing protein [Mycobacterium sp. WUMAC-067]|uniref:LytR C-terminal domain-containing protein n=1 Tax=unclassified Mycobacterium TaxID=2642494 RepID=UPI001CDA3EA2|nr:MULTISPECIES: LytR C-terminal domain-containing protein [unclassified Mycobacterium]MCA2242781.1 LytR C-terminal domain-containing protein [Mycobacterium sp. WUMAC-067]MCA2315206.1 LytR C-terminal domain-containing protein [Mycobacterium sp. WUMAC-025]